MAAMEVAENLLISIRKSPLNFIISETPYSVQISLRKRFRKDAVHQNVSPVEASPEVIENVSACNEDSVLLQKDIDTLKVGYAALEKELERAKTIIEQSNEKQKAAFEKHNDETRILKAALGKTKSDVDQLHSEIHHNKQVVKSKEKEIHNMSKSLENKNSHISTLKHSNGDLKSDKSNLETKIRTLEKKINKKVVSKSVQTVFLRNPFPDPTTTPDPVKPSSSSTTQKSTTTITPTSFTKASCLLSPSSSTQANPWLPGTPPPTPSPSTCTPDLTSYPPLQLYKSEQEAPHCLAPKDSMKGIDKVYQCPV